MVVGYGNPTTRLKLEFGNKKESIGFLRGITAVRSRPSAVVLPEHETISNDYQSVTFSN